ncbi:recombinase family protein [Rhizobium sp. WYJ-E13]|uniref:recombinase family protein n=1 Tax=Rhizobium sp. WYJ-E13 TaxID=2849093 RepID=UPI001C1EB88B|nr:recombinase family protein [Rhizobium sp. WYJ-E13]QWW67967.1 recombinase family protein [Rhizobium sp. WYJ-E13]
MKTILYARVSTVDQTADHQLTQARQAGFEIDEVVVDQGVSGVNVPLAERPEGRRLFDMLRKGDTLVVRWVDRLGRNYADVTDAVRHFIRKGVIIKTVINNLTFDGTTTEPMQMAMRDAMIGFMAGAAQSQAEALKIAQRAGIDHAKAQNKPRTYKGRKPSYTRAQFDTIARMLAEGGGASEISKATGLTRQTILRIRTDPSAANDALADWGL